MGKGSTSHKEKGFRRNYRAISSTMATVIIAAVTITLVISSSFWTGGLANVFTRFEKVEVKNAYVTSSGGNCVVNIEYVNTGSSPTSIDSVLLNGVPYSSYSPPVCLDEDFGTLPSICETGASKSGKIIIPLGSTDPSGNILADGVALVVTLHTTNDKNYPLTTIIQGSAIENSNIRILDSATSDTAISDPATFDSGLRKLHTEGRHIVDGSGRKVILRGVNRPNMDYSATGHNLESEKIMANIASWGCNCIRLPFAQDLWIGDVSGYKGQIDRILSLAEKYGIYVILDRQNEVAGINGGGVEPLPSDVDAWISMWVDIAIRYMDRNNVLFDIKNEPYNCDIKDWITMAQRCVNAIRAITDTIIIIEPLDYGLGPIDWVQTSPIQGGNIVYSMHWYQHWRPISDISKEGIKVRLNELGWTWILDNNVAPILVGETSAWTGVQDEYTWYKNFLSVLNDLEVGYLGWAYVPNWPFTMVENDWLTPSSAGVILIDSMKSA